MRPTRQPTLVIDTTLNDRFGEYSRNRRIETVFNPVTGIRYLGSYRRKNFKPDSSDSFHTVTSADTNRLDVISAKYYNTDKYWWVIAEVNRIANPRRDVPVGKVLRIPELNRIMRNKALR